MVRIFAVAATLLAAGSPAWAHPGHNDGDGRSPGVRLWKAADNLFELEAVFMLARDNKVLLGKLDGSRVWIELSRLCGEDQAWVQMRMREIQALNRGQPLRAAPAIRPDPTLVNVSVLTAVMMIGVLAWRSRRQPLALPAAVLVASPLCMLAACSARNDAGSEEEQAGEQGPPPAIVAHFQPFKDKLKFRWTESHLFIDSNGLPDHPMMIGITNWQQQVPLPQPYAGKNAWQIPLQPKLAEKPISARNALFRGAIALAVNGVPIFNALNNRGEDAFLIGELDAFGGHCGKGDDYHYHIAPLHLEKIVGKGKPIAFALDGFPLYGLTDEKLDEFNGRFDKEGNYRYHATTKYPYINGGMRGVVQVRGDGIEPQPQARPIRPEGRPLKGAKITGFTVDDEKQNFSLKYEVKGETRKINYTANPNGTFTFVYVDGEGNERKETYARKEGKGDEKKKKVKGFEKN